MSAHIHTWIDGYIAVRARAYEMRGAIELDSGARWPRTTGEDAIAIAALFDGPIRTHGTPGIDRRWRATLDELEGGALEAPQVTFSDNRAFWSSIEGAAVFLDDAAVAAPAPALWDALIAQVGAHERRNAGPSGDSPFGHFDGVKTFDDMFTAQLRLLREKRGVDTLAQPPGFSGGERPIPRTTNADVIALAGYWTAQLARVKHIAERDAIDSRWKAATADVDKLARTARPDDQYAKNNEFWRTLQQTAIHVAVADESPSSTDLALDALKTSLSHLPQTIGAAASKGADFVADVAHAAGKVANEAGKGLLAGFGTPLLVGAGLLGLYFITRPHGHENEEA